MSSVLQTEPEPVLILMATVENLITKKAITLDFVDVDFMI